MPGPRPVAANVLLKLHFAAQQLLRGSDTEDQKLVANNLIAALRRHENLWLDYIPQKPIVEVKPVVGRALLTPNPLDEPVERPPYAYQKGAMAYFSGEPNPYDPGSSDADLFDAGLAATKLTQESNDATSKTNS